MRMFQQHSSVGMAFVRFTLVIFLFTFLAPCISVEWTGASRVGNILSKNSRNVIRKTAEAQMGEIEIEETEHSVISYTFCKTNNPFDFRKFSSVPRSIFSKYGYSTSRVQICDLHLFVLPPPAA